MSRDPNLDTAEKVAELSWLNWVSALGSVPVPMRTTVESGIGSPLRVSM